MTEEKGKKEEEELEFMLDHVRVLALRHARDNRDFYGRRYARRDLAWEGLAEEEREDYYYIRLSYRPARGFRGEPGVELFTIDKAGPIELRLLVTEPRPKLRSELILSGLGVLAIAVAVVGGLFAAGVLPPGKDELEYFSLPVRTDSRGQLVSPDGGVTVDLPAGSIDAPSQLSYRPLSPAEIPVLPAQYVVTDMAFDLTMDAALLKSLTITVRLSAADAVQARGDSANIVIQHYKEDGRGWTPLHTTADFEASTARARVDSLSMFALTIRAPKPIPAPAPASTPTAVPTPTPTPAPISPTPAPTPTPVPMPTVKPALGSTPQSTATPAPMPTATAIPVPTPARVPTITPPIMYSLDVTLQPAGLGKTGLNPASDDGRYTAGRLVRATASCDNSFEGWTGDLPAEVDPSSPSIIVAMDRERKLVANCAAEPPQRSSYALTINGKTLESGQLLMFVLNGTVSLNQPPGVRGEFGAGSRVVLLVTPSQPEYQVSWQGVDSVDGRFGRVEMREDREVEVTIERPVFTLAAGANPLNGGSVTGAGEYLSGTYATLQAIPSSGWQFTDWSGDCSGDAGCIVIMDSHKSVTTNFQAIGATPAPTPVPTPTPTPTGGRILFSSDRDGNHEIYVMNVDGTGQTNLTNDGASDTRPRWSPDGSKIVFTSFDGIAEIYVMNPDGSNPTNLTNRPDNDSEPAWSPDGTKMAFVRGPGDGSEIYVMNADGSGQTRLTQNSAQDSTPAWSSSNKIAFSRSPPNSNDIEIYVMNADGSNLTRLTNNTSLDRYAAWSPNGTRIVFSSFRDGNAEIYVMNSDGSSQTRLTNNSANDQAPDWES